MQVNIYARNIRAFSEDHPLEITLQPGRLAFVGPNNSGKSTVFRVLQDATALLTAVSHPTSAMDRLRQPNLGLPVSGLNVDGLLHKGNSREGLIRIRTDGLEVKQGAVPVKECEIRLQRDKPIAIYSFPAIAPVASFGKSIADLQFSDSGMLAFVSNGTTVADFEHLWTAFRLLRDSVYIPSARHVTNYSRPNGSDPGAFDLRFGREMIRHWSYCQNGTDEAMREKTGEISDFIAKVMGVQRLSIQASHEEDDFIVHAESHSYKLSQLGAGLAQFLVVLANLLGRRPSFIFVDEPELSLHPSLQLLFVEQLERMAQVGLVYCTHSLPLARLGSDDVFVVQRNGGRTVISPYSEAPRLATLLGEMSYSSMHEVGYDTVLLVEGNSEGKVLREVIRTLGGQAAKVLLLPLGGSSRIRSGNTDELAELARVARRTFCLIDSERTRPDEDLGASRTQFVAECKALHIGVGVLEKRAIENYFSSRAISAALGGRRRALEPYERLADHEHGWNKRENWRIAREMTREEWEGTDLASFLAPIIAPGKDATQTSAGPPQSHHSA